MIKNAVYTIIIVLCFLQLLACGKEKTTVKEITEETEIEVKPEKKDSLPAADDSESNKFPNDCSILKEGKFTYKDTDGDPVKVSITDRVITEEHKGGKYVILSKMTWVGECEYNNMLMLCTIPDFKLPPGTVMNVTIDKVEGKTIAFTATANGKSYHNVFTKIK